MNPRLAILCFIAALLCSCTTDSRYYGMDAARMVGQKHCLIYKINDKIGTAALFEYDGRAFLYTAKGGCEIATQGETVQERFPGCAIIPVFYGTNTNIPNGCLPQAVAEVRAKGGHVEFGKRDGYNHAYRVPK